jgi:hypothetical protein
MEDILKKLELARKNLEILNKISPSNTNSSSIKTQSLDNNNINIKAASENLSQLSSLSGTDGFQQINISNNKIPESWSPQLNIPLEAPTNIFVQPENININKENIQTSYKEINVQSAEENVDNLAALSGTYEFQTLQIVGNTIPQSWCPEVVSTTSTTGSGLLSDLIIDTDPVQKFGLGNMSLQNSDDVNITGGKISVDGFFNTGVVLSGNSFSTGEISIRSPLINFKNTGSTNVFLVPTGYIFLINTMEIVTLEIDSLIKSPKISFGNTTSQEEYCRSIVSQSNSVGSRHIIKSPQNGIQENTIINMSVLESSDSSVHNGFGIIRGSLIKIN